MNYIELASLLFGVGAGIASLATVLRTIRALYEHEGVDAWVDIGRFAITSCALGGVALWSWRIAEAGEAFGEALK